MLLRSLVFLRDKCSLFFQRFYESDASKPIFNLDSVFKVFSWTWTWSTVNYADFNSKDDMLFSVIFVYCEAGRFGWRTKREWSNWKHEKAMRPIQVPNLAFTQTTYEVIQWSKMNNSYCRKISAFALDGVQR